MPHSGEVCDIAVVGAGAAGLMTAIAAARERPSVRIFLIDSREKFGAKILMSGGTRCNVTNQAVTAQDYEGGPRHFLKHVLQAFTPDQTREFFETIGVDLVLEPTGKYFPTTHSGKTVLEALVKEVERLGVVIKKGVKILSIDRENGAFFLSDLSGKCFEAKSAVLTTGGLSYPETGSDGTGYVIAKSFGHTLVPTAAALTPLETQDEDWKGLSGITLFVRLSFFKNGKKEAERYGSFLFTHLGFSGPAALDISRFFSKSFGIGEPTVEANFLPSFNEEKFKHELMVARTQSPMKWIKTFLQELLLPERLVEALLKKGDISDGVYFRQFRKDQERRLTHILFHSPLNVSGVLGYKKAEVTAGGIDLAQIRVGTMESKLVPGLYFAGEILDIDGRIGGFNFQWAWSTGTIAGRSAARSLKI